MEREVELNVVPINDLPQKVEERVSMGTLKKYQRWLRLELVGVCLLMAVVWALLTLPIIFYYLPVAVSILRLPTSLE